jgi:nicotinate-nucleotide pyrophosphorylase (carboxylating)
MTVEVEVESEGDLREAVAGGADVLLIDNQSPETVSRWSRVARQVPEPPEIEASGKVDLESVRAYALAGADSISIGRLTHSVEAADISLEISFPGTEGTAR